MDDDTSPALRVAMTYYRAWTGKDMDAAMACFAPGMICDAPAGRLEGVDAYRAFLGPFSAMLIKADLIAAYGDADQALLMYDTTTPPVPSGPGAEFLTVRDGLITYSRFLFDRLPFELARRPA